ncbi:Xanthine/uracil permease [Rhizopogon vinicolor AM-OR11-026]|uniref:Xanthine/uracil permease n=1 Tax=Rhizopogon vinicolor AM-OR11-026 TaxID=1314800 RepID=A0A1B7MPP5_9AGAM|nr:Xanthine/uracil permease [Rhizopogon vinicolor AM-OR11-026]
MSRASVSSVTKEPSPAANPNSRSVFGDVRRKVTTKHGWLGDYDYGWLCLPSLPTSRRKQPLFYGLDDELPLVLAMASGLQHALALLPGNITPPIVIASSLVLDPATSSYMISASLIACGILTLIQMSRVKLWKGYYLGTGLLSVVGTSFATLSVANAIFDTMYSNGTCPSTVGANGTTTRGPCPDAYGMVVGTSLICSFFEMGLSFVLVRVLRRIFPPMVTGTVIVMIGADLIGASGMLNWGGGSNGCQARPTSGIFELCPTIHSTHALPWGSPQFIGLGFLSFVSIIFTELFGSPFLKNASIIVGLAVGCIVAGAAGYMDGSSIKSAPTITFLWVHRFKINVYPPAILPMLAVYMSAATEAIGDIAASAEVSRLRVEGEEFDSRIQGGLLSDGIGGFLSALFTVVPVTIYAQSNGIISATRCANRAAGRWCCVFLILFGILGKLSGVFLAIPSPVIGGVTTFLFASVIVSGLRVLSLVNYTRRNRFILTAAMSFGVGDLLVPNIFNYLFEGVKNPNNGLQGLFDSITILLSSSFLISGLVAIVLNLLLPDYESEKDEGEKSAEVERDLEIQM